jgi:hypothetical protein
MTEEDSDLDTTRNILEEAEKFLNHETPAFDQACKDIAVNCNEYVTPPRQICTGKSGKKSRNGFVTEKRTVKSFLACYREVNEDKLRKR